MRKYLLFFIFGFCVKIYRLLDPCKLPLGLQNGMIRNDQIEFPETNKDRIRLKSVSTGCWYGKYIWINFGKHMTITGLAFKGTNEVRGIRLQYYEVANRWNLKESFAGASHEPRILNYTDHGSVQRIWFEVDTFTVQTIVLEFPNNSCKNLQLDIFGCSELCHSQLVTPTEFNNLSGELQCLSSSTSSRQITLGNPVTITGILISKRNTKIQVTCKLRKNVKRHYVIPFTRSTSQDVTIFWFDNSEECDEMSINGQCINFNLVGCQFECMKKLPASKQRRRSSSFQNIISAGKSYYQTAPESYLNNGVASWQENLNARNSMHPWIRTCFSYAVVVSGVAMQAQGRWNYGYIKNYILQFSGGSHQRFYDYSNDDGNLLEFESRIQSRYTTYVNRLPTPVAAVCIQVTATLCPPPEDGGCALRWDILGCEFQLVLRNFSTTDTSVYISWRLASASLNDLVKGYHITLYHRNIAIDTKEAVISFQNLDPFTMYTIKVYAYNSFNVKFKVMEKNFKTQEGKPSRPHTLNKYFYNQNTLYLTWNAPDRMNGQLKRYKVFLCGEKDYKSSFLERRSYNSSSTFINIQDLSPGTNYTIYVSAVTGGGEGNRATITLETKSKKPSRPRNVASRLFGSNYYFQWEEPTQIYGRIISYKVYLYGTKDYYPSFQDYRIYDKSNISIKKIAKKIFYFVPVTNPYPGTKYTVNISAVNKAGEGDRGTATMETNVARPNEASMKITKTTQLKQRVTLYTTPQLTGSIKYYQFSVSNNDHSNECFKSSSIFQSNVTFSKMESHKSFIVSKGKRLVHFGSKTFELDLAGAYKFCYRAVVGTNLYGTAQAFIYNRRVFSIEKVQGKNASTTRSVTIPKGPYEIKLYAVVVSPKNISSPLKVDNLQAFNESNPSRPYITGVFETYRNTFTIGDGEVYQFAPRSNAPHSATHFENMVFTNTALKGGQRYWVSIRLYDDKNSFYSSPWLDIISVAHNDATEESIKTHKRSSTLITTGIVVAVACVVILIIVILYIIRRNNNRINNKVRKEKLEMLEKENNDQFIENKSCTVEENGEYPAKSETLLTKIHQTNLVAVNPNHPPLKLENIPTYWMQLRKNNDRQLKEDFKALNSGQLFEWTEGADPALKLKNRYRNILAYNHSRVKLQEKLPGESDYINASFIHGYSTQNMYIATQGPSVHTVADFWQMIWEQNVSIIVMVTNLIENSKTKCHQYWPENGVEKYGNIDVMLTTTDTYADFVIRNFIIKKDSQHHNNTEKTLQQYHYLSWPDHGVPEYPSDLLKFQHKLRKNCPVEMLQTPMVVHCSAGVGRSGTFICIDNMIKLGRQKGIVDVFNFVNHMRNRRPQMVQTEDQYRLIYHALFDVFICGLTEILVSEFQIQTKALHQIIEKKKTGYRLQFEVLSSVTPHLHQEDTKTALQEDNKSKNRSSILARDTSRVMLTSTKYNDENTGNYINAVYVNGYKRKYAFIATEHPLENTVYEFWKMIFEKKVTTVVMLNTLNDNGKGYEMFWPGLGEKNMHKNLIVEQTTEERKQLMVVRKCTITNIQKKDAVVETCIISYEQWPENDVPQNPRDVIQLLTFTEKMQGPNSISPVVVLFSNGAGRTGTFIAISILLEQMKMEQAVDVLQTIKKIRLTRPEFVANLKQYEFCYKVIQAYLDSFSTYSNFA